MRRYNVDVAWDDPFERVEERRHSRRFGFRMKVSIRVAVPGHQTALVGPGLIRDFSLTGAYLITKHDLTVGQQVTLAIPTEVCSGAMLLPKAFVGPAAVVRTSRDERNRTCAALEFGAVMSQNMEFAMFMQQLQSMSEALAS